MPWRTRLIQVLLETWHNEFGRLSDKASPQIPSQKLPVLGANTNEGINGVSSQTYGTDRKIESTKGDTVDQHESIKDDKQNVGTNNSRCEYIIATPHQGCARPGNRNFPNNGKQRACKLPKIYGNVGKMPTTSYVQYSAQYMRKTDYTGHHTYGTSHNTDKCQTDYIVC